MHEPNDTAEIYSIDYKNPWIKISNLSVGLEFSGIEMILAVDKGQFSKEIGFFDTRLDINIE